MSASAIKGYVLVVFSGLVILAAVLLVVLQWGNDAEFSLYGKNVDVNTALLMIASAAGGFALLGLVILFVRGARILHRLRSRDDIPAEQPQ